MTAEKFRESFNDQIKDDKTRLEKVWGSKKRFTSKMKETIKNAIRRTHKEAKDYVSKHSYACEEYVMQTEYFNIDLVAWEQKKDSDFYNIENGIANYQFKKFAWDFDIAIEHENDRDKWADEVIKLAYIFCKLRVVIGYFPYIEDNDEKIEMQRKYLSAISKTIKTLKCHENMKHGDFMIILGDAGGNESDRFEKLKYTPYIYEHDEEKDIGDFVPLLK